MKILLLSFFTALVLGVVPFTLHDQAEADADACDLIIDYTATWCKAEDYYCFCGNPYCLASLAACLRYPGIDTIGLQEHFIEECTKYTNLTLSHDDFEEAYVNYTLYGKNPTEIPEFNISAIVDYPIMLNDSQVEIYVRGYRSYYSYIDNSYWYGIAIVGYFAVIFLLAAIWNWSLLLVPSTTQWFAGPVSDAWRKYVTMSPLARKKRAQEQKFLYFFDFLVPSRLETLVLAGFSILVIIFHCIELEYVGANPIFPTRIDMVHRYLANRTGVIPSVITPLMILFAGRNNFLQWLTRWNFATFITYHRWMARVVFILVALHSIIYTVIYVKGGYYKRFLSIEYFYWGIVATVVAGAMMLHGMMYLRRRWYEMFLIIHYVLAVFYIVGCWYHLIDMGYIWFYYASIAIWVLNVALRVARLSWFGFPKSEVILLPDYTLKVIVPKPSHWKPIAGGHAFVHFIRPSCFWQSHPFTFTECSESPNSIVFYCKVKGGVTHGLYNYLRDQPGRTKRMRVGIEGPYGSPTAAYRYSTAVFIAGGNGIPGIYSEVLDAARRSSNDSKQILKLIWIVKEYKSSLWFYEELLALKNTKIQTTIYVTTPNVKTSLDEYKGMIPSFDDSIDKVNNSERSIEKILTKEKDADSETYDVAQLIKNKLAHIEFKEGRPNIERLVVSETQESAGSIAFVACGHPIMVDDVRLSVVNTLGKTEGKRLDFFEQLQIWA